MRNSEPLPHGGRSVPERTPRPLPGFLPFRDGRLRVLGWPIRRQVEYLKYLTGVTRSSYAFGTTSDPRRITIVIPCSSGDIAINSSVTRYYKKRYPNVHVSLITRNTYTAAGDFNRDYDAVLGCDGDLLSHADQLEVACRLTPDMDRLFLSQPTGWCDALSASYTMLELQNRLCEVPARLRHLPRLQLPTGAADKARRLRAAFPGPALFISREASFLRFGQWTDLYCYRIAAWCVNRCVRVFWNSLQPIIDHEFCVAVGMLPLDESVALAVHSDAVISMRSGFSDIVGFSSSGLRHRVFYPEGNYPYSRLSWLHWCSLSDMGVISVTERTNGFTSWHQAASEVDATIQWLVRLPTFTTAFS